MQAFGKGRCLSEISALACQRGRKNTCALTPAALPFRYESGGARSAGQVVKYGKVELSCLDAFGEGIRSVGTNMVFFTRPAPTDIGNRSFDGETNGHGTYGRRYFVLIEKATCFLQGRVLTVPQIRYEVDRHLIHHGCEPVRMGLLAHRFHQAKSQHKEQI